MFRSKAEKKLLEKGYDPARLPPGQYLTEKWPVLHAGSVPRTDLATWTLRVFGEVESPVELSWERFNELPRHETTQDIHCVTRWSRFDASFSGVHWETSRSSSGRSRRAVRRRARRAGLHLERSALLRSRTTTRCSRSRPTASR